MTIKSNLLVVLMVMGMHPICYGENSDTPDILLGYVSDSTGVEFQVKSSGCTKKSDFFIQILEETGDPAETYHVALHRTKTDVCRMLEPYGTRIRYSWDEIGLDRGNKLVIINPLEELRSGL